MSLNYLTNKKEFLRKYKEIIDGTLCKCTGSDHTITLKKIISIIIPPNPRTLQPSPKKEVDRLVIIGMLNKINNSQQTAPTHVIPKINGAVRFVSDFRQLYKALKRKPFQSPNIQHLSLKLEGLRYATSLDLSIGYYSISLCPFILQTMHNSITLRQI